MPTLHLPSPLDRRFPPARRPAVAVIGKESVGKSALLGALAGAFPYSSNFRGSTLAVERYRGEGLDYLDTPGIVRESDARSTTEALASLGTADRVLLVVQATHLDDDLAELLPLVAGRPAAVAVTFWDRVAATPGAHGALAGIEAELGVPVVPVDARNPDPQAVARLRATLRGPAVPRTSAPRTRAGWRIEPRPGPLDRPVLGPLLAGLLLIGPALLAVMAANSFAGRMDPIVSGLLEGPGRRLADLPRPLSDVLAGDYGLLTMGPLLLVWAVPTVIVFALVIAAYKSSGLADRISETLHPILRPFGVEGRDLVRVMMGFGCNVPAVANTRSCSACTRGPTLHAIAFGSACSYQLGATLAVFAAAGRPGLVVPYLLILGGSSLLYLRVTSPPEARAPGNLMVIRGRSFLQRPGVREIGRDAWGVVSQFIAVALPVFFLIASVAALLDWSGVIGMLAGVLGPAMAAFRLPIDAALPVVMASIRKDGLLLFAQEGIVADLSAVQLLTGVYLAGVLLPCLVTALAIVREETARFAGALIVRQAAAAVLFSLALAWVGWLVIG
jgi:ferrous iron transport protein B